MQQYPALYCRVGDNEAGVWAWGCNPIWNDLTSLQVTSSLRPYIFCPFLSLAVFPSVFFFWLKKQIRLPSNKYTQTHTHTNISEKRGDRKSQWCCTLGGRDVRGLSLPIVQPLRPETGQGLQLLPPDNGALGGGQDWQSITSGWVQIERFREVI